MNVLDLALVVILFLIAVNAVQSFRLHNALMDRHFAERRADVMHEMLHNCRAEADAYRKRAHTLERRYATLQTLHADNVRSLLARNYPIIENAVIARRNARN